MKSTVAKEAFWLYLRALICMLKAFTESFKWFIWNVNSRPFAICAVFC